MIQVAQSGTYGFFPKIVELNNNDHAGLYVIVPVYGTRYTVTVYVSRHMYTTYTLCRNGKRL